MLTPGEIPTQQISPQQRAYILALDDSHRTYTRFFNALLITRPSHQFFYADLCSFRIQPSSLPLFAACDPTDADLAKDDLKLRYRAITKSYLVSRFAHPWCRKALSVTHPSYVSDSSPQSESKGLKISRGWWAAEWGSTGRQISRKEADEEERLHRLFVPIWIVMRARMFPGHQAVERWCKVREEDEARIARVREFEKETVQNKMEGREGKGSKTEMVGLWLDRLDVTGTVVEIRVEDTDAITDADAHAETVNDTDAEAETESQLDLEPPAISPSTSTSSCSLAFSNNSTETTFTTTSVCNASKLTPCTTLSSIPEHEPTARAVISAPLPLIKTDLPSTAHVQVVPHNSEPKSTHIQPEVGANSTKANNIPIPLHTSRTTPNLRQSFWDSEEARTLERDLARQRQNSASTTATSTRSKRSRLRSLFVKGYDSEDEYDGEADNCISPERHVAGTVFRLAAAGMLIAHGGATSSSSGTMGPRDKWRTKRFLKKLQIK